MLLWSADSDRYIALVEQAAVLMGIIEAADLFRNRDIVWYEDNAVVLAGLVKGANGTADLDNGCCCIHLSMALLHARAWWEYIESAANWADGASRLLEKDPFVYKFGFHTRRGSVPSWPWTVAADRRLAVLQQVFSNL